MKRSATLLILMLGVAQLWALCSCTQRQNSNQPSIPVGDSKTAYFFDSKHAVSITIAKADPASGDHWMARVERAGYALHNHEFHDDDPWSIQAYSESSSLADTLANRIYIIHLLDTLQTYRAVGVVRNSASAEQKSSYGLNPPRYALKWQVWDPQTQSAKTFETEIGNLVDPKNSAAKESYGTFPPSSGIYRVDGAAIAMLDYLKGFTTLRQEVLSPVTSDDIDEIEITRGKRKILYAQRDGDRWTNEKHKPWNRDVGGFLDRITHLRVEKFLDSEVETSKTRALLEKSPLEEITLKDRAGNSTLFHFARLKGEALAEVSTRAGAVFELYPTALDRLQP